MSKLQDDFSKIPMKQPLESVRPWDLKNLHFKGTRSGKETRSGCFSRGCGDGPSKRYLETENTLGGRTINVGATMRPWHISRQLALQQCQGLPFRYYW